MSFRKVAVLLLMLAACKSPDANRDRSAPSNPTGQSNEPDRNILVAADDLEVPDNAPGGGTLRRSISAWPAGYNWLIENSVDVQNLQSLVHAQFARQNFHNPDRYVPDLAHEIRASEDWTVYDIHLREGVYWQVPKVDFSNPKNAWLEAPREITAEDCVFFFDLVKAPDVEAGALKNYYRELVGAEALDRYTCRVRWREPVYHSRVMTIGYYPLPKWLFTRTRTGQPIEESEIARRFNDHWASDLAVGAGPYTLVEERPGERIILERNRRYYGVEPPIERIIYRVDRGESYDELAQGRIDLALVSPQIYARQIIDGEDGPLSRGELRHDVLDRFAYYYIGWNTDSVLFSERRVRRAMTHAIDRRRIIRQALHGLAHRQDGPYYHTHPANDPSVRPHPFDLNEASRLLEEAGWSDTDGDGVRDRIVDGEKIDFEFELLSYVSNRFTEIDAIIENDLREIGVEMEVETVNWPTMQQKLNQGHFDAFTGGWGLSWLIDPYQIWHSSQSEAPNGSNRVGFRNDRADHLIETLRRTFDEDERREHLRELHRIIHREQPYTFLFAPQDVIAWQPRVKNVNFNVIRPQIHPIRWYIDPNTPVVRGVSSDDEPTDAP